jgi:hypothetical protein
VGVSFAGVGSVWTALVAARFFVLAALRVPHLVLLLVAVVSGYYLERAGGELVGEMVRGPVGGWDVQGVGTGAGAADEA